MFGLSLLAVFLPTPLAAVGIAAGVAAVPIIIHLLNRKRYVIVPWAAMRFLLMAQKQNVRRLKLEQWLLLLVRILIGVLIIAAIAAVTTWADPLWKALFPGGQPARISQGRTHRIIVIDSSFSMAAHASDGAARFENAKAQAQAVLERSSPGDGFSVVLLTAPAQTLVPGPVDDRAKVAREIEELVLPHGSADLAGGLHAVAEMTSRPLGKYAQRQVVFITDLKRATWSLPAAGAAPERPPEAPGGQNSSIADTWRGIHADASVAIVDVAREDADNLAVTALTLGDPLPLVGMNTSVSAVVRSFSRLDRKGLKVELLVAAASDGKPLLRTVEQKLVDVPAYGSITVNFALERQNRFREAGDHVVQVRIDGDMLPLDDSRTLAVSVRETVPVLLVNGKTAVDPLERSSEWLSRALYPFPKSAKIPGYPARPRTIDLAQFADVGQGDLSTSDVVFLCDMPRVTGNDAIRLDTHLRRGGSVVIVLGPNAAQNLDHYNRVLFNEGKGLLPGRLLGVQRAEGDNAFALVADEDSFQQAPLAAFRGDNERAGLTLPRFKQYVRLEAPIGGAARRILSFIPASIETPEAKSRDVPVARPGLDAAVVEWPRHRGRVVVFTSTLNTEWTNWPLSPTFPPFVQELLRFALIGGTRQTVQPGEPLEEYVPATFVGVDAYWRRWEGNSEKLVDSAKAIAQDEAGLARFAATGQSGIYRVSIGSGRASSLFAVNVPVTAPTGGSESDLRRMTRGDIQASAPGADIQIVSDAGEIQQRTRAGAADAANEPASSRGPAVARAILLIVVVLMLLEVFLAWRYGSARASVGAVDPVPIPRRWGALVLVWLIPLVLCAIVLVIVVHALLTGNFLGFLSGSAREHIERILQVPAAVPGEGTRWRLEANPVFSSDPRTDRWLLVGVIIAAAVFVFWVYRRENPGGSSGSARQRWLDRLTPLACLRFGLVLLTLLVLLPQLRLTFQREGWPDVVIAFDDSRSMATVDNFRDTAIKERVDELKKAWEELAAPRIAKAQKRIDEIRRQVQAQPGKAEMMQAELGSLEARVADLRTPHRLNLIKALLASSKRDWLRIFLEQRQMRVHLFRMSVQATHMAELADPAQCEAMLEQIIDLVPAGESSHLGDGVVSILKRFRGGSLNALIMFTDGVTTKGEDLPGATRLAWRMGVPFYLVGVGDSVEPPDIILSDIQAEDSVNVNDRLVFEARVKRQGPGMPDTVPVILSELKDGKKVELARETAKLDANGKPTKVRLTHTPTESGEKTFIIEVPLQKGETEPGNNRHERVVFVAENKRIRVLVIEGFPRYEFRFLKSLFERETEAVRGNKAVELNVLLLSAHENYAKQDRSAISRFPTSEELNTYDVVIVGDIDPRQLPRGEANLQALADFVKERGGGLLVVAGEHWMPQAFKDSPLASVLPVTWDGLAVPERAAAEGDSIVNGYRPRLTAVGQNHPIFRFAGDESENAGIWGRLPPLLWYAQGYRRKLSAEVLATHPERPAEQAQGAPVKDEKHPLVLQQFVGAGRVLFFGFDETWRWRLRQDEVRFNQFWLQTIRSLARTRVGRVEVRLDRQTAYRRDEPIRIMVRFPDDVPPPGADVPVRVSVERRPLRPPGAAEAPPGEAELQTLTLAPREGTRASYETILTRTPEGEYRFTLTSPNVTGVRPRAEARVLPPPGEMDRLQLNETDLQRAAKESRGVYYPLDKAENLLDDIPAGARVALDEPRKPLSLWDHWLMFALVFGLIAAEWGLRKRWRLL